MRGRGRGLHALQVRFRSPRFLSRARGGLTAFAFASPVHRDLFIADPNRYAPQLGGFCAGAIVYGVLVPANPESWAIVDGKLYMVAGPQADIVEWKADAASNIQKASGAWTVVVRNRSATQNQ